ncbi:hypothetical protein B0I35DRAFT_382201 [Stachybotrys elegans]|uniref:FAD-binding PCMH-type domain-containing protein n=1 Tax=Stachybotrys elegans TaxID=80388 RepID=A0A8K0SDF4_9HYPO|nr:hypothetical protein B0I35DRAFT_382201 [Stachybotrys elegans]
MRTSRVMVAVLGQLATTVVGKRTECPSNACASLAAALPGDVAYPNTTSYQQANSYWSARQAEALPDCFVSPKNTEAVSVVMKILTARNKPFTVKSGGHTAFMGGSSVTAGVTVDLANLNNITVSEDGQTVSVGPGNRWIDVSQALDPLGLAVVGGRAGDVGVSGLILGGGISYFSERKGWACDNVRNFEVVVASGDIVNASPEENEDLYWALRGGGGSNFGIVTRFDLASFEQGDIWSSSLVFAGALNTTLIPLFQDLTVNGLPSDPDGHTYFVLTHQPAFGGYIVLTSFFHATIPSPPDSTPPIFTPFRSVPGPLFDSTSVVNISTQSQSINIPYGSRQTWWDTTIAATSADFMVEIVSLFEARNDALFAAAGGSPVVPFLNFQPISTNVLSAMRQRGGNSMGLDASGGPLMIVQLTVSWEDPSLDAIIEESLQELIGVIERRAEELGLGNGFVYMNYAGSTQRVQHRFGPDSEKRLKAIAKKWDPQGKLAQWRGYFKLED